MAKTLTLKEKLLEAALFAHQMQNFAKQLNIEAKSYDVKWPLSIANNIEVASRTFLTKLK